MVWWAISLVPETGRSRLEHTVPSSSHTPFVTNPDHDIANQHRDVWGVSQPRCALHKGSAEHIRPPEYPLVCAETHLLSTSQLLDNRKVAVTQPSRHTNPA